MVLDVQDPGASSSRRVELVRDTIVFAGVSGSLLDSNAGLLTVTTFNQQTPRKVKAALEVFRGLDLRGLVLDLRENGGGSYSESCQAAGYFVGNAAPLWLVRQVGQANAKAVQASTQREWDKPIVVLVGSKTAGSGELLASALKSSGRAKLLGQTTSGTVSLKSLEKQPDGTSRKVEQAHCFTVQDERILGQGIKPDIALEAGLSSDEVLKRAIAALPNP